MNYCSQGKSRHSGIELLRIFAMLMIVAHHFAIHGIFSNWNYNISFIEVFNTYWSVFLCSFGKVGVDIFVIITGYFNISKEFRLSKALNIYLQTVFYALLVYIGFLILGKNISFINSCSYWFIKYYLILYLLTPILNKLINKLPQKYFDVVTILVLVVGFILPLVLKHFNLGLIGTFIALYFIGAYYKLKDVHLNKKYSLFLLLFALAFLIGRAILKIDYGFFYVKSVIKYMSLYSIFTLIFAVCMFDYFLHVKLVCNEIINKIAKSVFGIYLIHDNNFIRSLLWNKLLSVAAFMDKSYFVLYSCIVIIGVFILCVVLDKILIRIFNYFKNFIFKYIKIS